MTETENLQYVQAGSEKSSVVQFANTVHAKQHMDKNGKLKKYPNIKNWQTPKGILFDENKYKPKKYEMGILTGKNNQLTVVDLDIIKPTDDDQQIDGLQWGKDNWDIDTIETFQVISASGGRHMYFLYEPSIQHGEHCLTLAPFVKIDTRNDGGYIHFGDDYKIMKDVPLAKMPDQVFAALKKVDHHKMTKPTPKKRKIKKEEPIDNGMKDFTDEMDEEGDWYESQEGWMEDLKTIMFPEYKNFAIQKAKTEDHRISLQIRSHYCMVEKIEHNSQFAWLAIYPEEMRTGCWSCGEAFQHRRRYKNNHKLMNDTTKSIKIRKAIFEFFKKQLVTPLIGAPSKGYSELLNFSGDAIAFRKLPNGLLFANSTHGTWGVVDKQDEDLSLQVADYFQALIKEISPLPENNKEISTLRDRQFELEQKERMSPDEAEELLKVEAKLKTLRTQNEYWEKEINRFGEHKHTGAIVKWLYAMIPISHIDDFYSTPHLLAFKDGVFNMITHEFEYRKLEATDFQFHTTGYEFPERPPQSVTDELETVLKSILIPDFMRPMTEYQTTLYNHGIEKYESLMDLQAASLYGELTQEIFLIMTGKAGRNGKGLLETILAKVFGNYGTSLSKDVITKDFNGNDAQPQVYEMMFCRHIVFGEPGAKDKLHGDILKKLTGNDDDKWRTLYGKPVKFRNIGLIGINTNRGAKFDLPECPIELRMAYYDFPFTFIKKHDVNDSTQKEAIDGIKQKFASTDFRDAMLYLLLDRLYKLMRPEGGAVRPPMVDIPDCVKAEGKSGMAEHSPVGLFLNNPLNCEVTNNPKDYVFLNKALAIFNSFHSSMDLFTFKSQVKMCGFEIKETRYGERKNNKKRLAIRGVIGVHRDLVLNYDEAEALE